MNSRLFIAIGCLVLIAADWPRFRGPNGDGISSEKNIPVTWSTTDNVLWSVGIPGKGHSSPIVVGEKIFLQTASDDGSDRALLCLNTKDGKQQWSYKLEGNVGRTHKLNNLSSGTPATDGERVYTLFWDGDKLLLAACDMAGKEVWKKDLGSFASQHGAAHSPAVHGDKVFVNNDQDGKALVQAFDAKTGKIVWEKRRAAENSCYGTPRLRQAEDGSKELLIGSTVGVAAYDPDTGEERWSFDWNNSKKLRMVNAPADHAGLVYLTTGNGAGNREMVAVRAGSKLPASTDRVAWSSRRGMPYVPSFLIYGDLLFAVHDENRIYCYDAKSGEAVWDDRLAGSGNVYSSPIIIDGKIYATNTGGTTTVLEAGPKFEVVAVNRLDEEVMASPAVADGKLFIRTASKLYCIANKE